MRTLSKFKATTFCFILCGIFPLTSQAQTYCSNLGSVTICDGGSTTITPLGRNGGVITTDRDVIPYSIMPAPPSSRERMPSSRDLDLDRRFQSRSTLPDPFADEGRGPFDLRPGDGLLLLPE
jgi:hypothetical protein